MLRLGAALAASILFTGLATLQAGGAPIEGEAGVGYVLRTPR